MESRLNSSETSSQDSICCSSLVKSKIYWADYEKHQRISQEESYLCVDVQRHFLWITRQWRRMCGQCQIRIFVCKEVWYWTMIIHWSSFRKEVVFLWRRTVHKESGTISRKRCCWNSPSNFPCYDPIVQRSIQKQRTWKTVSIHFVATQETIEAVFRIIVSANQLSLNGWIPSRLVRVLMGTINCP